MKYLIIGLLAFSVVQNVLTRRFGFLLAVLGLILIVSSGSYTLLWQAQNNLIALLSFAPVGVLQFYLSLVLSNSDLRAIGSYFPPKRIFLDYLTIDRLFTARTLLASLYEELLWRGALLFAFGNTYVGLTFSSFLFAVTYMNRRRETDLADIADIFVFAVFQGVLMILLRNIYLVMLTHTIRNLLIYFWALQTCDKIESIR